MSFANLRFLWTICLAVLLLVPAVVWAQKDKKPNPPPPPPPKPAAAPAQRPATNTVNRPSQPAAANKPAQPTRSQRPGPKPPAVGVKPKPGPKPPVVGVKPKPKPDTVRHFGDNTVRERPNGTRREILLKNGIRAHYGLGGQRTVVRELPGGRRVVFTGRNYGHMERNYARGYRMRTYYENGRYRAVVYRPYYWRGRPYYVYAPYYYYRPVYYGWAYNPWAAPAYYQWGWAGNPWYGYYGYYFAPAPFYPGADLWLTDYILAENLRMAYDAQQNAGGGEEAPPPRRVAPANPNDVQLSPEVKQMIAEEVKQQLAAEKAAAARPTPAGSAPAPASNEPPPALDPGHTVFVVASNLDVATPDGNECELTPGDVINRIDDTPDNNDSVQVRVSSSKEGDCARGSKPAVKVADLEDMSNRFREQLDAGLQQLAANSGKNGLPAAPDTSTSAAADVPMPEPDKDVYAQLQGLQKEAEQAEQDVNRQSSSGQTGGGK